MLSIKNVLKKKKNQKIDLVLRNYLSYMLSNYEKYSKQLDLSFSDEQRREFVTNCALNTIDEYILRHRIALTLSRSSDRIFKLFKENFELRQFERNELYYEGVSEKTRFLIQKFECLRTEHTNKEKNEIMCDLDKILTGTY